MHLEQPWALLLLFLIPVLIWLRVRQPHDAAIRFYSAQPSASLHVTLRARLSGLPCWLRLVALCLVIFALARPQSGAERRRETGNGIAIFVVIDRSPSMLQPMVFAGRQTTRLTIAKQLFQQFVRGRTSDVIGIVAFARHPETVSPLTFAHDSFSALLDGVYPPPAGTPEAFTAIGDAIALASARLKAAAAKSKVIVLLTDGENTAGARSPLEGAQLAARLGVRVHAIGIVGAAPTASSTPIGQYSKQLRFLSDRDLSQVAAITGGIYRSARDGEALQAFYAEIDKLEKSELARTRFTGGTDQFAPWILTALALLVSASILSDTWLRRIP